MCVCVCVCVITFVVPSYRLAWLRNLRGVGGGGGVYSRSTCPGLAYAGAVLAKRRPSTAEVIVVAVVVVEVVVVVVVVVVIIIIFFFLCVCMCVCVCVSFTCLPSAGILWQRWRRRLAVRVSVVLSPCCRTLLSSAPLFPSSSWVSRDDKVTTGLHNVEV